jgi:hypothetical protein
LSVSGGVIAPAQTGTLIQPKRRIAASPLQRDAFSTESEPSIFLEGF